jgi:hypothetical protein
MPFCQNPCTQNASWQNAFWQNASCKTASCLLENASLQNVCWQNPSIMAVSPIHCINQMSDKLALSFVNLSFSQGTKNAFND